VVEDRSVIVGRISYPLLATTDPPCSAVSLRQLSFLYVFKLGLLNKHCIKKVNGINVSQSEKHVTSYPYVFALLSIDTNVHRRVATCIR